MIFHRIDRRNPEAITNRAVRAASPALDDDIVVATEIDDVPGNQKITGKPELGNKCKFFFELVLHPGVDRSVTLLRAKPDNTAQESIHRRTRWHRVFGKFVPE